MFAHTGAKELLEIRVTRRQPMKRSAHGCGALAAGSSIRRGILTIQSLSSCPMEAPLLATPQ